MLLGDLFGSVTLLHHAGHLAEVPNKRIDRYRMPILRNGERVGLELPRRRLYPGSSLDSRRSPYPEISNTHPVPSAMPATISDG